MLFLYLVYTLSILCLCSVYTLSLTLYRFSLRSMASMLCTQCMPRRRMALLSPICWLLNCPSGLRSILIHKSRTDMATIPRVINDSFNIICYICVGKDTEIAKYNQIL